MIKIIGIRRIVILSVLIVVNALLALALYMYVLPQTQQAERELRSVRGQVQKMRSDAQILRTDIGEIEDKKGKFNLLETAGFRGDQNRLEARRRIMDIQRYSKILKAGYNIGGAEVVENTLLEASNQVILQSKLDVDLEAIDDIDIYAFVYWLQNTFPGHVHIETMEISRERDVNDITVRQIGAGQPLVMVKAKLSGFWRTVVSRDVIEAQTPSMGERF